MRKKLGNSKRVIKNMNTFATKRFSVQMMEQGTPAQVEGRCRSSLYWYCGNCC